MTHAPTLPSHAEIDMHTTTSHSRPHALLWVALALTLVATLLFATRTYGATAAQTTFATPDDAVTALVQAVKAHDTPRTRAILGNDPGDLSSGDKIADRTLAEHFVEAFDAKHALVPKGDALTLTIGADDFPFAFPLVKTGDRWHFDTAAGRDELLARRIGQNELGAIETLRAIADAQREYASRDRNGDGVLAYATKFASSKGKHDGLYWPTAAGEAPSPLGELVVHAAGEGYAVKQGQPTPYHGYYFRLLRGQGANAAGGAQDYVVKGRAIGGFAVVAYPAKYASSGIMTFIVNQDGKVLQSDLGPDTVKKARAMTRFDPSPSWAPVAAK